MRVLTFIAAAVALLLVHPVTAQKAPGPREIAYGQAPLQRLDFYAPRAGSAESAPLVMFIHGGGWRRGDKGNATGAAKITHYPAKGWAFASVNYRLVPDARVEDSAQDVADAVALAVRDARRLGVDPRHIVLMGHSAGAHLAALVATDPRYLRAAGLDLNAVAGVVLLDGAGYDVPRQLADGGRLMQRIYRQAFGEEPARQRALSPTAHAAAPNAARFLILHVERDDGRAQSEALAAALRRSGTAAEVRAIDGRGLRGHMEINRSLGEADYPATAIVDEWIAAAIR